MNLPQGDRTPVFEQYMAIKSRHPDALLFYRMGDFYEMFYDDARIASELLGLRLTSRAHGKGTKVPLAGFPYHQLDSYLNKAVAGGQRVVIVEQMEDPKKAKGLVKRDVVRIVTAGTNPAAVESEELKNNRIAALIQEKERWGCAWADLATGEFSAGEMTADELKLLSAVIAPVELVIPESSRNVGEPPPTDKGQPIISTLVDWVWEFSFAKQTLLEHFATVGLKGFGIEDLRLAVSAAGALLYYLKGNLRADPSHLTRLSRAEVSGRLIIEPVTRRNLELSESLSGNPHATLFAVMDRTVTGAGRRLLYARLLEPLTDRQRIEERLDVTEELSSDEPRREKLRLLLRQGGDLQRHLARLATGRGSARDLVAIREILALLPEFQKALDGVISRLLQGVVGRLNPLSELREELSRAFLDEPPLATSEGGMIRDGYNPEVDDLCRISRGGKTWLEEYEREQRSQTGVSNLRVGYNRVFGYYIEVTKSHLERIPPYFIRRQTLTNAERFTTTELQEYENKVVNAEELLCRLESEIYQRLVEQTLKHSAELQENAAALAEADVQSALALLAVSENYHRPRLTDDDRIVLTASRHPVVEKMLPPGEQFVPNDLEIGGELRIIIVTGPNMAGKSTYLRQIALTVIMAQMGSFVPAKEAGIGIVDKLFTRIGALDNLAGGESTFLVEMQETASILHNATTRSLVLFDEVGRGTSTFDGLSLAWAIVEYLHETPRLRPRTLFATHYHELVDLEKYLSGVANRNVAVKEYNDRIIFLRKIIPGGCDRSFGIHVAQMAGIPAAVISRAKEVLVNLEANDLSPMAVNDGDIAGDKPPAITRESRTRSAPQRHLAQLTFFDPTDRKLREKLEEIEVDKLTPVEALNLIAQLKELARSAE